MNKYILLILALLFIFFSVVQFNDPDTGIWVVAYGFVSVTCILGFFNKINRYIILAALPVYFVGSIYLWPETFEGIFFYSMDHKPHIELARESLGLLISFSALTYLFFYIKKADKA